MAVKMRLARAGAKKSPFYRVVVADAKSPRDGRFIEQIGTYDPTANPAKVTFDEPRLEHWLKVGAIPSQTVGELIARARKAAPATAATSTPA
jgi:small subunit ribosomal protein S16